MPGDDALRRSPASHSTEQLAWTSSAGASSPSMAGATVTPSSLMLLSGRPLRGQTHVCLATR